GGGGGGTGQTTGAAPPRVPVTAPGRSNRPRCRGDSGSTRGRAGAAATPIGTLTNSTHRHEAYVVSRPPVISPTAPPATLIAAYTPIARLRGWPSGKVVVISASAAGAIIAAPAPCTARAASS